MFYLICYFNLPLYFRLFVCFVIQGFKVQSSYSYVGTCQPALLLNVMKSFCWSEPCVPNCMCIPLSMLWILTVHKKIWRKFCFWMHFRQPRRKVKIQKSRHGVSDLCPRCSWVLTESLLQFTKGLTQFVVFDWLQSCSSVGLHCASLLAHSLPQSEAPPSVFISFSLCFTSSHIVSTTTGWSVYNNNIRTTVKRDWTWCV